MEHGYDIPFLCELESRLMCPICMLIMRNAVQTICGHRFCGACIKRVVDGSAVLTCPMDRSILKANQIFPDVATRREILCLPIKCTNSTEGCTWRGELIEMPNHQSTCGFERVPCTHGCGTRIRRSEIDQHMTQCPSRQVPCLFCCERVPHSKMISHTEQCPKAPVTCSMCGSNLLRDELSSHQDIDSGSCPKSIIHCPYSYTGCTYKAERSKIQEHITENGTLDKHMNIAARKLKIIKDLHEKSTNDVQTLTAQLKMFEQIRSDKEKETSMLTQQLKSLETQISDARINKDRDLLTIKAQLKAERADFEKKLHEQALKYEAIKSQLEAERTNFEKKLHEEALKYEAIKAQMKAERADFKKKLHEQALELEIVSEEKKIELLALTKQLMALKADSQNKCHVAALNSAANDVVLGYSLRSKYRGTSSGSSGLAPKSNQSGEDGQKAIPTVLSKPKARKEAWTLQEIARLKEVIKLIGPDFKRIYKEFKTSRSIKSVTLKAKRIISKDKTLTLGHTRLKK